jgi:hypothetical protein
MTAPKQIIEQSIEGALGYTVNPGDKVVFVTTGWGNAYISEGVYLGYIDGGSNYRGSVKKAKVEVHSTRNRWMHADGTEYNYTKHGRFNPNELTLVKDVPYTYKTTLNLNRMVPVKA